jgi:hypothetical protein
MGKKIARRAAIVEEVDLPGAVESRAGSKRSG